MPRSRKPHSARLRAAREQEKAARAKVRRLEREQAEFDREVLAECGQLLLNRTPTRPKLAEFLRGEILPAISDRTRRQRFGELLDELTGNAGAG